MKSAIGNFEILDYKYVVLGASAAGFYFNSGTKRSKCRHESCGWKSKMKCFVHKKCNNTKIYGWCEHDTEISKSVKCSRIYFTRYKDAELVDPKTKVELIALAIDVATLVDYSMCKVAIYDLLNDKWASDSWWVVTRKGNLSPAWGRVPSMAPKDIHGIEEVIEKVKAKL